MKRYIALILALALCLTGCAAEEVTAEAEPAQGFIRLNAQVSGEPLRIGTGGFGGMWCAHWAEKEGDRLAAELTNRGLVTVDRAGAVLYRAAEGEDAVFNGLSYTYRGIADLDLDLAPDGAATYTWTLAEGLCFTDGTPVTADDLIFTYYLCLDPSYDGVYKVGALPIRGLDCYLTGAEPGDYENYRAAAEACLAAPASQSGEDVELFEAALREAWHAECAHISAYCRRFIDERAGETGYTPQAIRAGEGLQLAFAMYLWGLGSFTDAGFSSVTGESWEPRETDLERFYLTAAAHYGDCESFFDLEAVGDERESIAEGAIRRFIAAKNGERRVTSIAGIRKIDERRVSVTLESYKASDIFSLDVALLPLAALMTAPYEPEAGSYGFTPGDTGAVKARAAAAPGVGPYAVAGFDGLRVGLRAGGILPVNTARVELVFTRAGADGVAAGSYDLWFGEYSPRDDLLALRCEGAGYGYIGINAERVRVGADGCSEQSRALRRALAAVLGAYRGSAEQYYGGGAVAAVRQLSESSFAYSGGGRTGDAEDALAYAIGMLTDAGYGWDADAGRFISAPYGASLEYGILIPGGEDSHPAGSLARMAAEALARIGLTLKISYITDPNELLSTLEEGRQELWAAAWSGTPDPDLYQLYHSENIPPEGTELNYFRIADSELDSLLTEARKSASQDYRRRAYGRCMDIIDDWGVEIPFYRRVYGLYIGSRVDAGSVVGFSCYRGWFYSISEVLLGYNSAF